MNRRNMKKVIFVFSLLFISNVSHCFAVVISDASITVDWDSLQIDGDGKIYLVESISQALPDGGIDQRGYRDTSWGETLSRGDEGFQGAVAYTNEKTLFAHSWGSTASEASLFDNNEEIYGFNHGFYAEGQAICRFIYTSSGPFSISVPYTISLFTERSVTDEMNTAYASLLIGIREGAYITDTNTAEIRISDVDCQSILQSGILTFSEDAGHYDIYVWSRAVSGGFGYSSPVVPEPTSILLIGLGGLGVLLRRK